MHHYAATRSDLDILMHDISICILLIGAQDTFSNDAFFCFLYLQISFMVTIYSNS